MKGKDKIAGYKLIDELPVPVFDVLDGRCGLRPTPRPAWLPRLWSAR